MRPRSRFRRELTERVFRLLFLGAVAAALGALFLVLAPIVVTGIPFLQPHLLTNLPSIRFPDRAGLAVAIVSSLWLVGLTLLFSLPLGIGAGIYLEEYAGQSRLAGYLQWFVANLAGVPSVVFGLLGLGLWVQFFRFGPVILAGALTLTPLVFPYIVIATQEALRAVPRSLRDASLAMGATKWQTVEEQVLPAATPGVLTGAIFAASRAIGETAPLLVIGAFFMQGFIPGGPLDFFTPLPVQVFGWALDPRPDFRALTSASITIFIIIVLLINLTAIVLRHRYQRRR